METVTRTRRQASIIARWRAEAEAKTAAKRSYLAAQRLPENTESDPQRRVRVMDLMGAEYELDTDWSPDAVEGAQQQHNVIASVPWSPTLVRRGERPRVAPAKGSRYCEQCGRTYQSSRSTSRFCGATCRQRAKRGLEPTKPKRRVRPSVAALRRLAQYRDDVRPAFVPFSREPLPLVLHAPRQSDYLGWLGRYETGV